MRQAGSQRFQLAGARTAEGEPIRSDVIRHERVYLVEQGRHPLYFIDDDSASARQGLDLLPKQLRLPGERQHDVRAQQVEMIGSSRTVSACLPLAS